MQSKSKTFFYITTPLILITFLILYAGFGSAETQMKKEAYVSGLLDQYNRDLQSCFTAAEKTEELTREKCIENINNSRAANLIKNWEYSDLLFKQEK